MKNLPILFALLFALNINLFAQEDPAVSSLSGYLQDAEQQAMEFANILLLNPEDSTLLKGTITDSTGYFLMNNVTVGNYLLKAKMIGFGEIAQTIAVEESPLDLGTLSLNSSNIELSEVVVKSQRPLIEMKADKLVMNVKGSVIATGNSALEVLAQSPGVVVDQDNNISLRGKQGVNVLIDGKSTYLSNEEVAKMLEGMAADGIDRIEIIQNPSAKYDAEGDAGVINIRLKKDQNIGLNGNVSVGTNRGKYSGYNSGLQLNYRNKKINAFGNYNYRNNKRSDLTYLERRVPTEAGTTVFDQTQSQINKNKSYNFKAGIDYFLSDQTTIGLMVNGNRGNWSGISEGNSYITNDETIPYYHIRVDDDSSDEWESNTYNINLKHEFDQEGREISVDADYSNYTNPALQRYDNYFFDTEENQMGLPYMIKSNNNVNVKIKALKADYSQPISDKSSLEMGVKTSEVMTNNHIDFEEWQDDTWVNDANRSNEFEYQENIYAAYLNWNQQIKKLSLQMGLRAEHTVSDGQSITLDERVERAYTNFFPSLSMSHQIGEKHGLSYSYSYRISRPNYQSLNPFIYYLDQYTFSQGNPFLEPEYAHSFSLTHAYNQFLYTTFSYSRTNNAITDVIEQNDEERTTYQTTINLDNNTTYALNIAAPIPLSQKWMMRLDLTSFYNVFQNQTADSQIDNQKLAYHLYMSNNWDLGKGWKAEASGYYRSALVWGIFELEPQFAINAGFSKDVFDGKGKIKFNINDIFNTDNNRVAINQDNIDLDVRQGYDSRRANLSFTYNFGKKTVKPARSRSTATDAEQNRVK